MLALFWKFVWSKDKFSKLWKGNSKRIIFQYFLEFSGLQKWRGCWDTLNQVWHCKCAGIQGPVSWNFLFRRIFPPKRPPNEEKLLEKSSNQEKNRSHFPIFFSCLLVFVISKDILEDLRKKNKDCSEDSPNLSPVLTLRNSGSWGKK